MDRNRVATVLGFAGALLVLAALVWLVGIADVLAALRSIDPLLLVVIFVNALLWLVAWGLALRTVLSALGQRIPVYLATLVLAAAVFANNVTPFGQAGGEPISGYLISRATDSEYETGLAAIASVDALHFVPSLGLALGGMVFVVLGAASLGRNLLIAGIAVVVLVVALPVAAYLGWRYRYELEAAVVRALTPVLRGVGRFVPGRSPPSPHVIEQRIETFFTAIDRVAASRTTLVEAIGFSALGWLLLCVSLWLSVYALGWTVPFSAVLLVVPMAKVAGITPLPGGLGGIEAILVALLISTTGIPAGVAGAAVLVHRAATYWFPVVVGGGGAFALGLGQDAG
jgi:hypothetical protein